MTAETITSDKGHTVQHFEWTGSSSYVFIQRNNIFYHDLSSNTIPLTTSGNPDHKFNGVSSWLYQEEIFGEDAVLRFSPERFVVAWAESDVSAVPWYYYSTYGDLYPQVARVRYQLAADWRAGVLPAVRLVLFSLTAKCTVGTVATPALFAAERQ